MFGSLVGTLGEMNPFRYRGYVYDVETGLYYLRSRYYKPDWGRFINADTVLGKVGALGTHNLFAYCANNPVISIDPDGREPFTFGSAATGYLVATVGTFLFACVYTAASWAVNTIYQAVTSPFASSGSSALAPAAYETYFVQALSNADTMEASNKSDNSDDNSYYFAYVNGKNSNILTIVNYPLNAMQARVVLYTSSIVNALQRIYSFKHNQYGVYTPTYDAAFALAEEVGGFHDSAHIRGKPGVYYQHFHDPAHTYHIWYGAPLIVP